MAKPTTKDVRAFAKEHLGLAELRPGQEEAIMAVLRGRDTLAIMPTGSGKSAIYQIAGSLLGGLTLVVSPLIALQRDQVESLATIAPGIAVELNSALSNSRRTEVLDAVREGEIRFLFLAPEQLQNDDTAAALEAAQPTLVVIDEAHCISEWGHDFRPDYLHLGPKIAELGHPTILGLTATAAPRVQGEIVERLGMRQPKLVVQDFDRPNIHLAVEHVHDADAKRAALLAGVAGREKPGIVYAARRRDTEEIAEALRECGVAARAYHAGLRASERDAIQDAFMADELEVIVATIAFGMGIDKPNVRFVWHFDISDSIDSYYQEIGRAGRDGEPADARLFYLPEDLDLRRFQSGAGQIVQDEVEQVIRELGQAGEPVDPSTLRVHESLSDTALTRILDRLVDVDAIEMDADGIVQAAAPDGDPTDIAERALAAQGELRQYEHSRIEMMRQYADLATCRRAFLLRYFDQDAPERCGNCDNCDSGRTEAATVADQHFPDNAEVTHAEWGDGKVIKNEEETVTVRFDSVGYKTLAVDLVEQEGLLTLKDKGEARS
jgi:ATP-dependent DNA helicase RecQ